MIPGSGESAEVLFRNGGYAAERREVERVRQRS